MPAPEDLFALKTAGDAQVSRDGRNVVYTVTTMDREKNASYMHLWTVSMDGGNPA